MTHTHALSDAEQYLLKTLGLKIRTEPLRGVSLPFYLSSLFVLSIGEIYSKKILLCIMSGEEKPSPSQFKKYAVELRVLTGLEPVFILPGMSSWDRARFIEGRIAFMVPWRQLYLPTILIDLREHFDKERAIPERLSYPAQFLVLMQILSARIEGKTVRELSREFNFGATTMSRAVHELLAFNLVETQKGKVRPLHFTLDKRSLWTAAREHLQSPVKSIWFVSAHDTLPSMPYAGMSALSRLSLMNEDARRYYAISYAAAKPLIEKGIFYKQAQDEIDYVVEVWAYDPYALSDKESSTVDPLSLYLSLAGESDERVRKAIEGLVEEII